MAKTRIEIARRIAGVIAIVLGVALTGFAETVTNVRGLQRENSKLVDIYYDLNATDGGTYYVEVEVVGRTSDVTASSFSGDVGDGVTPGQNRHVVWDAGADWPNKKGEVKATVIAINGGKPNKVQLWAGGPYWADRNIGALKPEDYGLYFWWGDTIGYKRENNSWAASDGSSSNFSFRYENVPTSGKGQVALKEEGWLTTDGVLKPKHDAAHVQWGGAWRMPTDQELSDLCYKCDWTLTTLNDVNGFIVCGRGGYASNRIFIPFTGAGTSNAINTSGWSWYWSSVPDTVEGYTKVLHVAPGPNCFYYADFNGRFYGVSIRPVQ